MKQQKPPDEEELQEGDLRHHLLEELSDGPPGDLGRGPRPRREAPERRSRKVPGRLIVKYREKVLSKAVKELSLAGIMSRNGQYPRVDGAAFLTRVLSAMSETADELVGIKSATVLEALDMMIVEVFNNSKASEYISKLSASLLHSEEVEYVEPDQEVSLADFAVGQDLSGGPYPNDPKFSEQWGMYNRVSNTDSKVLMAWRHLGINGSSFPGPGGHPRSENAPKRDVIVAVIDTGVDFTHPDLAENMWVNEKELYGRPGVDDDLNGYVDDIYGYDFANNKGTPVDDEGHGTHCAGTIAARGNNNEGISGINWRGVKIMALKFLRGNGIGFLSDSVKAINYAIKMGANILSNSWGGGSFSQATYDAIKRSIDKNMLFVVAAGNDHNNNDIRPTYPSAYQLPNVLSVAAIDIYGRLGVFSNYGQRSVDMAAPGVDILSTSSNRGYKRLSGTSMACPFVSGAAALLYAFDPNLTFDQAKALLLRSVTVLPALRSSVRTSGTLNIHRAVQMMTQEAYNQGGGGGGAPRTGSSWISYSVSETIGPHASSTLRLTAFGEKPGSFTSTLVHPEAQGPSSQRKQHQPRTLLRGPRGSEDRDPHLQLRNRHSGVHGRVREHGGRRPRARKKGQVQGLPSPRNRPDGGGGPGEQRAPGELRPQLPRGLHQRALDAEVQQGSSLAPLLSARQGVREGVPQVSVRQKHRAFRGLGRHQRPRLPRAVLPGLLPSGERETRDQALLQGVRDRGQAALHKQDRAGPGGLGLGTDRLQGPGELPQAQGLSEVQDAEGRRPLQARGRPGLRPDDASGGPVSLQVLLQSGALGGAPSLQEKDRAQT
ncbi:serine protease, subtilase family, signal peptide [Cryptosporidium felis]|nr:serine protease, subtilase family, signal peptide [Cryptosporidium felis]